MKTDQLASIGFYTLEDSRAQNCSVESPLWRCELLLTNKCNFNCPYCRKRSEPDIDLHSACVIVKEWAGQGLRNIRFSGGEPTLYHYLDRLCWVAKAHGIRRIAISTNGSADAAMYDRLLQAGVDDFSISLDACCASTGDIMAGTKGQWDKVVGNIRYLSRHTYTTVGVVLTEENVQEVSKIIQFAHDLGVQDIRIISAAQNGAQLPVVCVEDVVLDAHPILNYRVKNVRTNRPVRGLQEVDSRKCHLVLDDIAMDSLGYHYPCIIYLRERGQPIGHFQGDMKEVRRARQTWFRDHDCYADPVCRDNCLDVCVAYNNRCRELKGA